MTQAVPDSDALYDRVIVERARAPQYAGKLQAPSVQGEGKNPMCGDKTRVDIALDATHIQSVRHTTRGCAICAAAADLMAQQVSGLDVAQAVSLSGRFSAMLVGEGSSTATADTSLGPLEVFQPLRSHKARIRCAELPWIALKEALSHADV